MSEQQRQQQEYEFVMEGISTRMTLALEKMAESNRMMSDANKRLGRVLIAALVIVALGFIVNNMLWMHKDDGHKSAVSEVVTYAGAKSDEGL